MTSNCSQPPNARKSFTRKLPSVQKILATPLNQLIEYTPRLQSLSTLIQLISDENIHMSVYSTLTQCYLHFNQQVLPGSIDIIFQSLPNLRHLVFISRLY